MTREEILHEYEAATCLSEWALEQQRLLDKYIEIAEKHYGEALKDAES